MSPLGTDGKRQVEVDNMGKERQVRWIKQA